MCARTSVLSARLLLMKNSIALDDSLGFCDQCFHCSSALSSEGPVQSCAVPSAVPTPHLCPGGGWVGGWVFKAVLTVPHPVSFWCQVPGCASVASLVDRCDAYVAFETQVLTCRSKGVALRFSACGSPVLCNPRSRFRRNNRSWWPPLFRTGS